ncbi:MAG: histidine kinase N-terminal 7TM domain-containing protein [Candidatus Saccharibacteria bacterium]|nr:histidine kinase N-terminal 7TM domain-containing protein [Candidatus Saccharibacteria bacterium]
MQLIAILLITVSILTLLSGTAVFFGSTKSDRSRSAWFFISTLFAFVWMISISIFLVADSSWSGIMTAVVELTYISAIFIDIALLGYISWKQKYGKPLTLAFLIFGILLTGFFVHNPTLLYSGINFSSAGNSLITNVGPFYFTYVAFFCCLVPTILITLLKQILKRNSIRGHGGNLVLLIGFMISGTMSLIFNLILPFWTWDYVWLGPLAISTTIIAFYYTILRYRALNLSSRWLKILSYIVIVASFAVIYIVIFYIIFAAMFKGSSPSLEVIILNFIMILIVLALLPATNELNMFIRSLISNKQVDMLYIIKKLSRVPPKGIDIKELAAFLAEHMHFEYIGILTDGQVYGSDSRKIPEDSIMLVEKLGNPEHGIWQEFDEKNEDWKDLDFSAVAALRNASGKTFGQVLVGKPLGKISFSRRDLVQVETIINLAAVIIDSKMHKKA